jgi:hypothetical protein
VALLSAWHLKPHSGLRYYHLVLQWTLFSGYQRDVSLVPFRHNRIAFRSARDPIRLQPGTFRLKFAPMVRRLPKGWYSLISRSFVYGPHCPKSGCAGMVRQTRFHLK